MLWDLQLSSACKPSPCNSAAEAQDDKLQRDRKGPTVGKPVYPYCPVFSHLPLQLSFAQQVLTRQAWTTFRPQNLSKHRAGSLEG